MEKRNEIWDELKELGSSLAGVEKRNLFTVPDGYFGDLADGVMSVLVPKQAGFLPAKPSPAGFDVPEGYFDRLSSVILDRISSDQSADTGAEAISPALIAIREEQPYTVPVGYFDQLAADIQRRLVNEEELPSFLAGLKDKMTYTVPEGYFAGLADNVLQHCRKEGLARVITTNWRSRVVKFAAAAVITGVLAFGALRLLSPAMGDQLMAMNTHFSTDEFDKRLEGVNDEDIIRYLESSGDGYNAIAAVDMVNEKELPDQDDYLFDDNAVDKFLNNSNNNADN